jgi:hypothetical protein
MNTLKSIAFTAVGVATMGVWISVLVWLAQRLAHHLGIL